MRLSVNNTGFEVPIYVTCNIPTFPLVARHFSQPGFGRSGGAGKEIIVETVEYNLNDSLLTEDK